MQRSLLDDFLQLLERTVKSLRAGDPLEEDTRMGPPISADQRDKVAGYVTGDSRVVIREEVPELKNVFFAAT